MNQPPDIFEEVVRLRREGIPAALATIVGTRGSTPGRTTMRLLVLADGTFLGTVGGGCLEAEVYDTALLVLADDQPRSLTFRLTEQDSPDSGLMCGGEVTIFVEPITTPALWIFGGGHVSKALCQVAALAGFRTTVVDDRAGFSNAERFPEAGATVTQAFPEAVAAMPASRRCFHSSACLVRLPIMPRKRSRSPAAKRRPSASSTTPSSRCPRVTTIA